MQPPLARTVTVSFLAGIVYNPMISGFHLRILVTMVCTLWSAASEHTNPATSPSTVSTSRPSQSYRMSVLPSLGRPMLQKHHGKHATYVISDYKLALNARSGAEVAKLGCCWSWIGETSNTQTLLVPCTTGLPL
jgi:hypothetical protein